jgi:hypothetical protein
VPAPPRNVAPERTLSGRIMVDRTASETILAAGGRRAPGAAALPALPAEGQVAAAAGSTLLLVFILSLFIPGSFRVGPIALTPYKCVLLAVCVPLGLQWIRGQAGRITATDVLMLAYCLWMSLAVVANHGPGRAVFVVNNFIDVFGAYLVGRVLVRSAADYRAFFRYFLYALLFMLPFAVIEFLTGRRLLPQIFGHIFSVQEDIRNKPRLGFTRATVPFHNPIHYGLVCSLAIANFYYIHFRSRLQRLRLTFLALAMTVMSMSSGPMFAAALQLLMVFWDRLLRLVRARWVLLVLIGIVVLALLEVNLPGGLLGYIVNEVIFNPVGGQNRIDILRYGSAEILRNPVFGIGFNDWTRPWWQSATVDNFWILTAMRYGIPALLLLAAAIGVSALQIMTRDGLSDEVARYRAGYLIALGGIVLVLGTVHVWGQPMVLVMLYIGAGVWLHNGVETSRTGPRALRIRDRAAERRRQRGGAHTPGPPVPARGVTATSPAPSPVPAARDGPPGERRDPPRRRRAAAPPERAARPDPRLR